MANIYVRSSDGNNADSGSSWALAKATLAGAAAVAAAGDTIYVSAAHSETTASALALTFAGTSGNPIRILSVDDAGNPEPPTGLLAGATIATTGASNITTAGFIYCEGLTFLAGDGANVAQIILGNANNNLQKYRNCHFSLRSTLTTAHLYPVNANSGFNAIAVWENCTFSLNATGQRLRLLNGRFYWNGGGVVSVPPGMATLMEPGVNITTHYAELNSLDFSGIPATANLIAATGVGITKFNSCKLPSGWTGGAISGVKVAGSRTELYNTDSSDTNYSAWIEDGYGSIRSHTSLYLSGTNGIAHNGANVPLSYKMTAEPSASYPFGLLEGMWMAFVNESIASQTISLAIIHNEAAALTDADIWLEVDYPATSGSTQYARATDAKVSILAGAAAQTASMADWDDGLTERANSTAYAAGNLIKSSGSAGSAFICTTAGTSAAIVPGGYTASSDGDAITDGTATFKSMRRQQLSVTITAAEQGVIKARPVLAKASAIVYVAAKLTVA
jgi:hypothetical protein